MEFFSEFGMFFLKAVTLVLAALVVVVLVARTFVRDSSPATGRLRVIKLNRNLQRLARAIKARTMPKAAFKRLRKQEKRARKQEDDQTGEKKRRPRVFVLRFKGDLRASAVESLRREVTAVLTVAEEGDEVILRLDSSGGLVNEYGLAASQLERLRERKVTLTVCVDRVAASGGYLMACVADRILAAPFAVVGSIGVVAMVPNLRRLLNKHDVDIEQHTAGEHKRTLTVFGENTEEGRAKFKEQLDDSHRLFKAFVQRYRPGLDIAQVATGEHWYGSQGVDLGLVDELGTSDDLLLARSAEADLFLVRWEPQRNLSSRLSTFVAATVSRVAHRGAQAAHDSRFV